MIYNLKTKITFGRYKGKTLEEVLNINPLYIEWCMNNIDEFKFDESAYKKVINTLFELHKKENLKKLRFEI